MYSVTVVGLAIGGVVTYFGESIVVLSGLTALVSDLSLAEDCL